MEPFSKRLEAVRRQLREAGWDAFVVPRADEYLGEYLPAHSERLRWLSGFTGSAGTVLITLQRAAVFVDGRYAVQVRQQLSSELFEYLRSPEDSLQEWLVQALSPGATVACDPRLHSLAWYRETRQSLERAGLRLIASTENLVDQCWQDRPMPLVKPALLLPECYSGESSTAKRARIAQAVAAHGADAALIFAPDAVSWLLNVRGTDVPKLPVLQSLALLATDGQVTLLVDPGRVPDGFAEHVGEGVRVVPEEDAAAILAGYGGKRVLADPATANAWTQLALEQGGAVLLAAEDPVLVPKACKNPVEIQGTRQAHIRDAVAEIRFLAWLDAEVAAGRLHDEATLAGQLGALRAEGDDYHDLSFDTISAAGANAAMCHYNHLHAPAPARLEMNSVYLVDSGGQYLDGTTDITRTVAIGDPGGEVRRLFTLVLKGHIALDQARFPRGTTGTQLDALARQFLWREGFDYDHGTGHGVGVFLSVHEAPQRISKHPSAVELRPGMIVSDEPGYYREGNFGMRCENLLVVRESPETNLERSMLEFEALTLVPFDVRLLAAELLSPAELDWLNRYHQRVATTIGPLLEGAERQWLLRATAPVVAPG